MDVLTLEKIIWDAKGNTERVRLTENSDGETWEIAMTARTNLIDKTCEYNDELANTVISENSLDNISTEDIVKALKEVTTQQVFQSFLVAL